MILETTVLKVVRLHLRDSVSDFLELLPDSSRVKIKYKSGQLILTVLDDTELEDILIQMVSSQFGQPFVRRRYVFSKEEIAGARLHAIGGNTAPVDKVETQTAATEQTCPRCRSGSRVVAAVMKLAKLPKQRLVQTIQYDILIDAELAQELLSARCSPSDLIPVGWRNGATPFYLIWPERTAPPMSPQSEGWVLAEHRPCDICKRNYSGQTSHSGSMGYPGLYRYSRPFLDGIPEDECGFYASWEYFGGGMLKEGETAYPPDTFFGRPAIFATKRCWEILRKRCKKQLESDPVFPEI
jgi:hypothetical protein